MDGFVTEDDVHAVVQVSEVVFCRWQLTGVVFWVIPVRQTAAGGLFTRFFLVKSNRNSESWMRRESILLEHDNVSVHELIQSFIQGDVVVLYPLR